MKLVKNRKIGNICFVVSTIDEALGQATIRVTRVSERSDGELMNRKFLIPTRLTGGFVYLDSQGFSGFTYQIKGCVDIQRDDITIGTEMNAFIHHSFDYSDIAIMAVVEARHLKVLIAERDGHRDQKDTGSFEMDPGLKDLDSALNAKEKFGQRSRRYFERAPRRNGKKKTNIAV